LPLVLREGRKVCARRRQTKKKKTEILGSLEKTNLQEGTGWNGKRFRQALFSSTVEKKGCGQRLTHVENEIRPRGERGDCTLKRLMRGEGEGRLWEEGLASLDEVGKERKKRVLSNGTNTHRIRNKRDVFLVSMGQGKGKTPKHPKLQEVTPWESTVSRNLTKVRDAAQEQARCKM